MKMTVCVPFFGHLPELKGVLAQLLYMTSHQTDFLFIDNGYAQHGDELAHWLNKYSPRDDWRYFPNSDNLGMVKTLQQAYELCTSDVLCLLHNDVFIYEELWDQRVLSYFLADPRIGMAGFFGAEYIGPGCDRANCWSNMLEAEIHGDRLKVESRRAVAIFDGFCLMARMEMLVKAGGFDQRYHYMHCYDRDAALESLRLGYRNIVIDVPCHHISGVTEARPQYQEWINAKTGMTEGDQWTHDTNHQLFCEKWEKVLPLRVNADFSFATGGILKGNAIVGYDSRKQAVAV